LASACEFNCASFDGVNGSAGFDFVAERFFFVSVGARSEVFQRRFWQALWFFRRGCRSGFRASLAAFLVLCFAGITCVPNLMRPFGSWGSLV
jgi:hypothetical protein